MRPIPGFENTYSAYEDGRIFAHPRNGKGGHNGKFLKPWKIGHGYETVALYIAPNKSIKCLVHRLVAYAYLENPEGFQEVNHKNGIITDNRPENLEWCTSKQNKEHAWKKGLYSHKGTGHYLAKLNEKKVRYIRSRFTGEKGQIRNFARKFQINESSIRDVIRHSTWKHIT